MEPGNPSDGAPDRAVHRTDGDAVESRRDALVLRRIDRLIGLDPFVALAVAVGVEDERRPALRLLLVAGFFEHLAVEPADDAAGRTAGAGPQRVVGVLGENQMVRRKAGVDQRELLASCGSYIDRCRFALFEREQLWPTDGSIPSCRRRDSPADGLAR